MARNDGNFFPLILIGAGAYFLFFRKPVGAAITPPSGIKAPRQLPLTTTGPTYIKWVQTSLNRLMGCGLAVDGVLGPLTKDCLQRFQTMRQLTADGRLGPETDYEIKSALGMPGYIEQPYSESGGVWY